MVDTSLLKYIPNYRINLITPAEIHDDDFRKFHTELSEAFQFIKYSKDRHNLNRIMNENKNFEHLKRQTVKLINTVTDSGLRIPEGEEEVNMCLALKEMQEESLIEGKNIGRKEGITQATFENIRNLMETMNLSADQAMKALKIPEENRETYLKML